MLTTGFASVARDRHRAARLACATSRGAGNRSLSQRTRHRDDPLGVRIHPRKARADGRTDLPQSFDKKHFPALSAALLCNDDPSINR